MRLNRFCVGSELYVDCRNGVETKALNSRSEAAVFLSASYKIDNEYQQLSTVQIAELL